MKALIYESVEMAKSRSRKEWEKHLGRKKHPEDVTEFLWDVQEHPEDARAIMVMPAEEAEKLPAEDKATFLTIDEAKAEGFFPADGA